MREYCKVSLYLQSMKKPGIRHSPPFDVRTRCSKEAEASGYLEPLVQSPQDKHRYLELLDDKPITPKKTRPGGVTYAQLAGSDHEDDDDEEDEEDSKGERRGKYDKRGRVRWNHMSPPKEHAPPPPMGAGGRFMYNPPEVKRKNSSGNSDLTGLGTNHWPQNNIPALPLPPPRESKFLRDPQTERMRPREKRRSSSLNARPLKRERERVAEATSARDTDEDSGGRIYPSRSELRKNPFVEDVGPRSGARGRGRGKGAARSQSAGRQDHKSRLNGGNTHKLPFMESNC